MQLPHRATELVQKIKAFIAEKKPAATTYRCCMSIAGNEITILYINKTQNSVELLISETLHFDNIDSIPLVFAGLTKKHHLENTPIYWLLSPNDYQVLLIDTLPVPEDEFDSALSWRVRNLIPYPLNEAVIDSFTLPPKKGAKGSMIGAVIAKAKPITQIITMFENLNLKLSVIDIPELAMRNLTALYESDEKSTAFIYFYDDLIILNITSQKLLYFTRRIDFSIKDHTTPESYEKLALEILRYFDYFQSQWRYPSPSRIFISANDRDSAEIANALTTYLRMPVEKFNLNNIYTNKEKIALIERKYLLELGCALREENA